MIRKILLFLSFLIVSLSHLAAQSQSVNLLLLCDSKEIEYWSKENLVNYVSGLKKELNDGYLNIIDYVIIDKITGNNFKDDIKYFTVGYNNLDGYHQKIYLEHKYNWVEDLIYKYQPDYFVILDFSFSKKVIHGISVTLYNTNNGKKLFFNHYSNDPEETTDELINLELNTFPTLNVNKLLDNNIQILLNESRKFIADDKFYPYLDSQSSFNERKLLFNKYLFLLNKYLSVSSNLNYTTQSPKLKNLLKVYKEKIYSLYTHREKEMNNSIIDIYRNSGRIDSIRLKRDVKRLYKDFILCYGDIATKIVVDSILMKTNNDFYPKTEDWEYFPTNINFIKYFKSSDVGIVIIKNDNIEFGYLFVREETKPNPNFYSSWENKIYDINNMGVSIVRHGEQNLFDDFYFSPKNNTPLLLKFPLIIGESWKYKYNNNRYIRTIIKYLPEFKIIDKVLPTYLIEERNLDSNETRILYYSKGLGLVKVEKNINNNVQDEMTLYKIE